MIIALVVIGAYLAAGIIALVGFDLLTSRVRDNLSRASAETQTRVVTQRVLLGSRSAKAVTLLATWVFWPVVFYGYVESRVKEGGKRADKNQR